MEEKIFKNTKTNRNFDLLEFVDSYGKDCILQQSSSVEPHIWLGVKDFRASIQYKDALKLGLNLEKRDKQTNEFGWCDYPIPKEVLLENQMHLNREQARQLGKKLLKFAKKGYL